MHRIGSDEDGQALLLVLGILVAVLLGSLVLGGVARAVGVRGERQRAADLGALAGARALREAYPRVFAPALVDGRPNPDHLERAEYVALGRRIALETARRNGAGDVDVTFPGDAFAPLRVRVVVRDPIVIAPGASVGGTASAEAELVPPGALAGPGAVGPGEYAGPLAYRQGQAVRPRVAPPVGPLGGPDAARRRAGVRPDGRGGGRRRHRPDRRERLSHQRGAGAPVRRPSGSEVGRATRHVVAPARHRARPRAVVRVRLARPQRRSLSLRPALLVGAVALRVHAERRHRVSRVRRRGR